MLSIPLEDRLPKSACFARWKVKRSTHSGDHMWICVINRRPKQGKLSFWLPLDQPMATLKKVDTHVAVSIKLSPRDLVAQPLCISLHSLSVCVISLRNLIVQNLRWGQRFSKYFRDVY